MNTNYNCVTHTHTHTHARTQIPPPLPPPAREEASCWSSLDQCPFVLGLSSENGELLLDQLVQVTEGNQTKERHLFLFNDVLVFAKLK